MTTANLKRRLARFTKGGLRDLGTLAELLVTEPKELFDYEIERLIEALELGMFDEEACGGAAECPNFCWP